MYEVKMTGSAVEAEWKEDVAHEGAGVFPQEETEWQRHQNSLWIRVRLTYDDVLWILLLSSTMSVVASSPPPSCRPWRRKSHPIAQREH
jgi:hypothetical protein